MIQPGCVCEELAAIRPRLNNILRRWDELFPKSGAKRLAAKVRLSSRGVNMFVKTP